MIEKFVELQKAKLLPLMFLSFLLLLISFCVQLRNKHLRTNFARKILDFLDDKMKANDVSSDRDLLKLWAGYDKKMNLNRDIVYVTLVFGILLEIIFFITNIWHSKTKEKEDSPLYKIEIISNDSNKIKNLIKIDTLK